MVRRVYIGNSGGSFILRASQPGTDVLGGDVSRMSIYEGQVPMVPKASGIVSVPYDINGALVQVDLPSAFSSPPFVLIKSTDGILPGVDTVGGYFVAGTTPRLMIFNKGQPPRTRTIKWWAFAEL